ncbi:MAG TPA: hypothetical protein VNR36_02945, partial [Pseudolysinimonas sp.]|nr:hypothetical protein [Pseudolysinimonas sp.]
MAFLLEVPGDGHRPGIVTVCGEVPAQLDDPIPHRFAGRSRVHGWSPRTRLKRIQPALAIPVEESVELHPADAVLSSRLRDGELLRDDLTCHIS